MVLNLLPRVFLYFLLNKHCIERIFNAKFIDVVLFLNLDPFFLKMEINCYRKVIFSKNLEI